ncbi:MAG: SIS domain-containing protein [Prolixibacteraceae bacterium]|jgi:D-sedoheptulose 7-phosphate isomerase|nr:SIS domain-containing protein [Prolixibacteraceae bacterium]
MTTQSRLFLVDQLCERYPSLTTVKTAIEDACNQMIACYENGGKILVCGNGGSCSDSDHIVGELMKSFEVKRPIPINLQDKLAAIDPERGSYLASHLQQGLSAISLTAHTALITAVANDIDGEVIFAQQVIGYGRPNDILIGISSSGNSQNVLDACMVAKAMNLKVIGLTGETGGKMKEYCDILINVPGRRTFMVQELHLPVYHVLCLAVEHHFFGK